ncbi:hypothetical protein CPLU01_09349 [Colletotrichum plurivorum]|uniref:Heterokaryon incompatibility domain-containing protein n=1 Tax=Colletotrichum plurivorum TaxID=2175906 RepID=A0A8H6K913_9PEZI|nr:hypothetical protein CPLU01_09349 [Colletotrichum plurivorum]
MDIVASLIQSRDLSSFQVIEFIMASSSSYSYRPLQKNQLRLLRFTGDAAQWVFATLEIFSVDDASPLPFHTLSYTWASEQQTGMTRSWAIDINGAALAVLDTLRPFVQALRSRDNLLDGSWWWIDSICIDQANRHERAQQVQLMRHMYLRADQVIVWLGEASSNSNLAMDFINLLDGTMRQQQHKDEARHQSQSRNQDHSAEDVRSRLQTGQYRPHWGALVHFLSRRWWQRIWTIQEFVMPPALSFWCGDREVSRAVVCRALSAADRCTLAGIKETIAFRYAYNRKRAYDRFREATKRGQGQEGRDGDSGSAGLTLLSLAAYFCCMDATDDRDRLYGLRALAADGHLLAVDYSLSPEHIYLQFAQTWVDRHKSLDVICFATVHSSSTQPPPDSAGGRLSLPSWVPDWHRRDAFLSMPVMASQSASAHVGNLRPVWALEYDPSLRFAAAGDRTAVYSFRNSTLLARGVVFDEVDGSAAARCGNLEVELVQSRSHSPAPGFGSVRQHPVDILKSICRCLVLDRGDRFLRHSMPTDDFCQDLITLLEPMVATAEEESPPPRHRNVPEALQDWYMGTRSLLIRGQSFEEILRGGLGQQSSHSADSAHHTPPLPIQDEWINQSFFGRFFDTVVRMGLRLMSSCDGRIGMIPAKARKGDLICVLYGCSVPVLLRRAEAGAGVGQDDSFSFVGECFVDGCMDGSVLQQGITETTFSII